MFCELGPGHFSEANWGYLFQMPSSIHSWKERWKGCC